jgi:hypothetical protein
MVQKFIYVAKDLVFYYECATVNVPNLEGLMLIDCF